MAAAGGNGRAEPARAPRERWTGNGTTATDTPREAPAPAGHRRIEIQEAPRTTEAPRIGRPPGPADVLASAPRRATPVLSPAPAPAPAAEVREGTRIQLREEQLEARKQLVELGEVRVRKEVVTEYRTLEVPVQREEVVIERQAPADGAGAASELRPGEEIRIPVREEQVTVEKRPVVKEEVTVGERVVRETERVGGEVRTEELRVEREGDVDVHDRAPEACSC
jgi:uncharacterized protein (TIGR02271 family)